MDSDDYDFMNKRDLAMDYFIAFGIVLMGLAPVIIAYWHYQ